MIRKYEEHVIYTKKFLSHLDTHYKVIKISDNIVDFLKTIDPDLFYVINSPPDYEHMITVNRCSFPTSESDIIFYIIFTIINNSDIKIEFRWGKSVKKVYEDKWSFAISFLRHLISKKEDYGKYYSFYDVVKYTDIDKLISYINIEYFNLYKTSSKFNL